MYTLYLGFADDIVIFCCSHTQHELSQFFLHARGAGSRHSECIQKHGVGAKISSCGRLNFTILRHLASVCRSKIFGLFAYGRGGTCSTLILYIMCSTFEMFLDEAWEFTRQKRSLSKRLKYFNAVVASTAYFSSQNNAI